MPTTKVTYYITSAGLKAGLANPDVLLTLQGILSGRAHAMTLRAFHKRGFIEIEQRQVAHVNHNLLVMSGAVERIRNLLLDQMPDPTPASAKSIPANTPVTYTLKPSPEPHFSPTVEKVKQAIVSLDGTVTFDQLAAYPDLLGMNPGTLRWAIQVLRRAGLCESQRHAA